MAFDHLEEDRRPVLRRLGEDLQQVPVLVAVGQDLQPLQVGVVLADLADAFDTISLTERPYLARMVGEPALEREEQRLIEEGALPGFAWWYCGVAKS